MALKRIVTASAILMVLAGAITGCGSGQPQQSVQLPALGPIPTITALQQISRPIDPYLPTAAQVKELYQAIDSATARCIKTYGLPPIPTTSDDLDDVALQNRARNQLYGFFNPDVTATKGYDVTTTISGPPVQPTEAEIAVLSGHSTTGAVVATYHGKSIPAGGCHRVGMDAMGGNPPSPGSVISLPDGGPPVPIGDPRVLSVDTRWSTCMKAKGYSYANPADAYTDAKWHPASADQPGPNTTLMREELATATADLTCKQKTDLMGVSIAVQSAYDKQYIASHDNALDAFKKQLDDRVNKAAQIIAAGGAAIS
jgi:hypothetical protein